MSAPKPSDDTYHSNIVSGDHGSQFQKNLFLIIFERLTIKERDFQLAYEMTEAGKFDDVVVFLKNVDNGHDEGWFFQAKHTDTSQGPPGSITYDMLFPKETGSDGDFSLHKYLTSYSVIKSKFQVEKKVFIFTNKDLPSTNFEGKVTIVDRNVEEILNFSGKNVGLQVSDTVIEEMLLTSNKKFVKLKKAILNLLQSGKVDSILYDYKTPLADVLEKSTNTVTFKSTFSNESNKVEVRQLYDILKAELEDIETAQLVLDESNNGKKQIDNLFSKKSRNKTLPILVDKETVIEFFNNLVFAVEQRNELDAIIRDDLQKWMKTWLHPEYFGKLYNERLTKLGSEFEKVLKKSILDKSRKYYMNQSNGKQCLEKIEKSFKQKKFCSFYVNRQIQMKDENGIECDILSDDDFAKELTGKLNNQKFVLLSAEPGMGKTTVFQYIAHRAQRMSNTLVYLIYLNEFNQELDNIKRSCGLKDVLTAFEKQISKEHCKSIEDAVNNKSEGKVSNIIMFFDAFDEIAEAGSKKKDDDTSRDKVLKIFEELLNASNIQIVVCGRRHIKELLEEKFQVNAMSLLSFSDEDQKNFLRKYWNVSETDETLLFQEYATSLLKLFHTENQILYKLTGVPLALKMLAEVEKNDFKEYLKSVGKSENTLFTKETVGIVSLFERFIEQSFIAKMNKLSLKWYLEQKDYESVFERFKLQHQLLAVQKFEIPHWQEVIEKSDFASEYKDFTERLAKQNDKSPLVEVVNNKNQFVHLSYKEFFVAQFIHLHMKKLICPEFKNMFCDISFKAAQGFFFAILESKNDFECLRTLVNDSSGKIKHEFAFEVLSDATQFPKVFEFLIKNYKTEVGINYKRKLKPEDKQKETLETVKFSEKKNANESNVNYNVNKQTTTLETAKSLKMKNAVKSDVKSNDNKQTKTLETIKSLETKDAVKSNVNSYGKTLLHIATQNNHIDTMKILLQQGADINILDEDGWTPLHIAVKFASVDAVKLLLENNAKVNIANKAGLFPASIAILRIKKCKSTIKYYQGKLKNSETTASDYYSVQLKEYSNKLEQIYEMMQLMIEKIDNVDATNKLGETLLHHAARKGDEETVNLLLNRAPNIDAQDKEKQTPLLLAARYNHIGVLKILLEKMANVDLADKTGWTPLHKAVKQGSKDAVELLLDRKANLKMADKSGHTAIHHAISQLKECNNDLNLDLLKMLIENLDDVNSINEPGKSLLHHAVKENVKKAVDILLLRSANINALDSDKQTALHLAARYNHTEIMALLLKKSASLNIADKDGLTPLHIAVRFVSEDAVELLLKYGSNIKITNNLGETPVHIVITRLRKCKLNIEYYTRKLHGDGASSITNDQETYYNKEMKKLIEQQTVFRKLLTLFIDKLDDVDTVFKNGDTLLHHAAKEGVEEAVDLLLNRLANVNAQDVDSQTPVYLATLNKRFVALKMLLDKSADVNIADKDGLTPLHIAAREGFEETLQLFSELGANFNAQDIFGRTPAHVAITSIEECKLKSIDCKQELSTAADKMTNKLKSCVRILEFLIEKLDDVDAAYLHGQTLLHYATEEGVEEAVSLLLKHSANVNVQDGIKQTPLHLASRCNNIDLLKFLLEKSADVELADNNGLTPLHIAARDGFNGVAELLLEHNVNVNAQDISQQTPLHFATMNNHIETLKLLLEKSADVNITDKGRLTSLHIAAREGFLDAINMLLEYNADLDARDLNGLTALRLAKQGGHAEIVELLKKKSGFPCCTGLLVGGMFVGVTILGVFGCSKFFSLK